MNEFRKDAILIFISALPQSFCSNNSRNIITTSSSSNGSISFSSTINLETKVPILSLDERSQMNHLMLLMILMICLGIAGVVTVMYMRIVQQKKMSKTALKSLMRYLAERELRKDNSNENPNNDRKDIEECIENAKVKEEIERSFEEDFNPAILDKLPSLPSKLTLAPLENDNVVRFPDPHLSHAKLPAIKKNTKTRMKTQYEELNPKELQKKLIEDEVDQNGGDPPLYEDCIS